MSGVAYPRVPCHTQCHDCKTRCHYITYWQAALSEKVIPTRSLTNDWAVELVDSDKAIHSKEVLAHFSSRGFLNTGRKVKVMSCGCKSRESSGKDCVCGKRGVRCTQRYSVRGFRCIFGNDPGIYGVSDKLDASFRGAVQSGQQGSPVSRLPS